MSKRPRVVDLIKKSKALRASNSDWYRGLSAEDMSYVDDVVGELVANPDAAIHLVAEQLITELNIDRQIQTVYRTLKRMVKHAQAKREKTRK